MVMTIQAFGCKPLIATVSMETFQTPMKWSHTFEDGEQAPLPMQVPAGPVAVKLFLKVELKKAGGIMHFKVLWKTNYYMRGGQCVLSHGMFICQFLRLPVCILLYLSVLLKRS